MLRKGLTKSKGHDFDFASRSTRRRRSMGSECATRFWFHPREEPAISNLALGAGGADTDANGWRLCGGVCQRAGYKVNPYIISKITDTNGKSTAEAANPMSPVTENNQCVIDRTQRLLDG